MFFRKRFKKQKENGSILMEVLLATVILSIMIATIIQAMSANVRASRLTVGYMRAAMVLEDGMARLWQDMFVKKNISDVDFGEPPEPYTSQLSVEPVDKGEVVSSLHRVTMALSWARGAKNNQYNLTTYYFDQSENTP